MKKAKSRIRQTAVNGMVKISPDFMLKRYLAWSDLMLHFANELAMRRSDGLHPKHQIMQYHKYFTKFIKPTDRVLDVGCNCGSLTFELAKAARHVTGIEIDPTNLALSYLKNPGPNISYVLGDVISYQFKETFDVCVMSNVLEHIDNRIEVLKKIKDISKTLLIRVPAIDRDWWPLYRKKLGIEWRSDTTHFIEYTEEELAAELKASGWNMDSVEHKWGEIYCRCTH